MTLHPPVSSIGFDMGTQWTGIAARFIGGDDQLLAEYLIEDFAPYGTGPFGYNHQGFLGFQDDDGALIHRVEFTAGDMYLDNLYLSVQPVSADESSWGGVKTLFR
jgi:hypothetical protein